jgi:WD40 repeat protein
MFLFAHLFPRKHFFPLGWKEGIVVSPFSPARNGRRGSGTYFIFISFSFSGFDKGKIVIWTPLDSKEKTRILISQHSCLGVSLLSFSPDGRFLASADINGKFIIWATEVSRKTERGSDHFGCNKIRIYSTLFQNWEPVYISEEEIRWGNRFSWLASSTDVPNYKLTFEFESRDGKV